MHDKTGHHVRVYDKILDVVSRLHEKVEDMEQPSVTNTNDMEVLVHHLSQFQSPQMHIRIPDDKISITSERLEETVLQNKSITESASKIQTRQTMAQLKW